MNEMKCGHCGSPEIQKALVIYESGTSKGSAVSAGGFGGRGGGFVTSSSSQTSLAKKLSPPPRMGIIAMIFTTIWAVFAGGLGLMLVSETNYGFFWLALSGLAIFCLVRGVKRNGEFPEKIKEYNKLWFCNKCGETSVI